MQHSGISYACCRASFSQLQQLFGCYVFRCRAADRAFAILMHVALELKQHVGCGNCLVVNFCSPHCARPLVRCQDMAVRVPSFTMCQPGQNWTTTGDNVSKFALHVGQHRGNSTASERHDVFRADTVSAAMLMATQFAGRVRLTAVARSWDSICEVAPACVGMCQCRG